jgi:hydroxymethylbilane synthase
LLWILALLNTLIIATRESALALWQAHHVAQRLRVLHPQLDVQLLPMTTRGDQILDRPLAQIGGKGLFLKELEVAMLEGRAHLAVHSLKDIPMVLEAPFVLSAVLARADASDALVSNHYASLAQLPQGARVGTSSLRRQVQLRVLRPDLQLLDLRGNVQTRLAKLDAGHYEAIVLASAGLQRLELGARIRQRLAAPEFLPAVGQASLGIEICADDVRTAALLAPLEDPIGRLCASAERSFALALGGSCQVPIGASATVNGSQLHLDGLIGDAQAQAFLRDSITGSSADAAALGAELAQRLLARGARSFVQ